MFGGGNPTKAAGGGNIPGGGSSIPGGGGGIPIGNCQGNGGRFVGGRAPGRRAAAGGIDIGSPGIPGSGGGGKGNGGIPGIMRRGGSCCGIGEGGIGGGTEDTGGGGNEDGPGGCDDGGIGDLESDPSTAVFGVEDELGSFSGRM